MTDDTMAPGGAFQNWRHKTPLGRQTPSAAFEAGWEAAIAAAPTAPDAASKEKLGEALDGNTLLIESGTGWVKLHGVKDAPRLAAVLASISSSQKGA